MVAGGSKRLTPLGPLRLVIGSCAPTSGSGE